MKCDRCNADVSARYTLKHVKYSSELLTEIIGTYRVCDECHEYLKESDNWSVE